MKTKQTTYVPFGWYKLKNESIKIRFVACFTLNAMRIVQYIVSTNCFKVWMRVAHNSRHRKRKKTKARALHSEQTPFNVQSVCVFVYTCMVWLKMAQKT